MKPRCILATDFGVGGPAFNTVFFGFSQWGGSISGMGSFSVTSLSLLFSCTSGVSSVFGGTASSGLSTGTGGDSGFLPKILFNILLLFILY